MKELVCLVTFAIFISLSCAKDTDHKASEWKMILDERDTQLLDESFNFCNESFRTDLAYIDALDSDCRFPDETDKTPKCFIRCILELWGVVTEEGEYDIEMAGKVFAGERGGKVLLASDLEDFAKACATRDEECMCEQVYEFTKCVIQKELEAW